MSLATTSIARGSSDVGCPPVYPGQQQQHQQLPPSIRNLANPSMLVRASSAPPSHILADEMDGQPLRVGQQHVVANGSAKQHANLGIPGNSNNDSSKILSSSNGVANGVVGDGAVNSTKKFVHHRRYDLDGEKPNNQQASFAAQGGAGGFDTSTPEYALYYHTHRALNPRIPAPLKLRNTTRNNNINNSKGSTRLDQRKTVLDRIQADFPCTPSPAVRTSSADAPTNSAALKPHPLVHSSSSVTLSTMAASRANATDKTENQSKMTSSTSYVQLSRSMHALDLRKNEPEPQPVWNSSSTDTGGTSPETVTAASKLSIPTATDQHIESNASTPEQVVQQDLGSTNDQPAAAQTYAQTQANPYQQQQQQYPYSPQMMGYPMMHNSPRGYMGPTFGAPSPYMEPGVGTSVGVPSSPYLNAMQAHALAAGQGAPGYYGYQGGYRLPASAISLPSGNPYAQHTNQNGSSMMPSSRAQSDASAATGSTSASGGTSQEQTPGQRGTEPDSATGANQEEDLDPARQVHALSFMMQSPLGHPMDPPHYMQNDYSGGMLSPVMSPMYQPASPGSMPMLQPLPPPSVMYSGGPYPPGGDLSGGGGGVPGSGQVMYHPMSPMYHPTNPYTFPPSPNERGMNGSWIPPGSMGGAGGDQTHPSGQRSMQGGNQQQQFQSPQQRQQQAVLQASPFLQHQKVYDGNYWPTGGAVGGAVQGGKMSPVAPGSTFRNGGGGGGNTRYGAPTNGLQQHQQPHSQMHPVDRRRAGAGGRASVDALVRNRVNIHHMDGQGGEVGQRMQPYGKTRPIINGGGGLHREIMLAGNGSGMPVRNPIVVGNSSGGGEVQDPRIPRNELLEELRNKMKSTSARPRHGGSPTGPTAQAGGQMADSGGGVPVVDWGLPAMVGHVQEFARDQFGSRFIQQQLERTSTPTEDKEAFFEQVLPHALVLCADVFGNYVIQKFFEPGVASVEHQRQLVAETIKGHMLELSLHMYGCRVVQKAVERLFVSGEEDSTCNQPQENPATSNSSSSSSSSSGSSSGSGGGESGETQEQVLSVSAQDEILAELAPFVMQCVEDQNGNHVIQKCIEQVRPINRIEFILVSFVGKLPAMSSHLYGCRVVQRMLEHCDAAHVEPALAELIRDVHRLVQDQYGNYVVQHIVQHGRRTYANQRCVFLRAVRSRLLMYSTHKFASNVVEKCLQFGNAEERRNIIEQMLGHLDAYDQPIPQPPPVVEGEEAGKDGDEKVIQAPLHAMMKDPYANYVVQKVLDIAEHDQLEQVVAAVRSNQQVLRSLPYGKHILTRLEKISL